MILAVPRAEKRFIAAMGNWISAVWRLGSLAAMRSPKALRHRSFASIPFWTWYPVQCFQRALPLRQVVRRIAELGLEDGVAGHRWEAGIDLPFLTPADAIIFRIWPSAN